MADPRRRARWELLLAIGTLLASSVLAFISAAEVWARVADPRLLASAELVGADLVQLLPASALVALAGVAGLMATAGWGRRVVASVFVATGAFLIADAVEVLVRPQETATRALEITHPGLHAASVQATRWTYPGVLAGTLLLLVGLATFARGGSWPAMAGRSTAADRAAGGLGSAEDPAASTPTTRRLWDRLDLGEDPTLTWEPRLPPELSAQPGLPPELSAELRLPPEPTAQPRPKVPGEPAGPAGPPPSPTDGLRRPGDRRRDPPE